MTLPATVGFMFKLEIDYVELDRLFADLPRATKAATANTVNIVARKVNKNLKKHISTTYNVPKGAMKFGDLVSIVRANARTDKGTASIIIRVRGRGLQKYGAKEIGPGLSVTVKKAQKTIKGGFLAPWRKGDTHKLAMAKAKGKKAGKVTRITKAGTMYQADKREGLYGPPIADLYTNKNAGDILIKTIDTEFQTELNKQFNRQFEKGGR
jgi:hypothetical protein